MVKKKLVTQGNTFKRTDGLWCGVVWYIDEQGKRKRKSFCGKTQQAAKDKLSAYIEAFTMEDEAEKPLRKGMKGWLEVFKFPSVQRTTYDGCERCAETMIFPLLGDKTVKDVTSADIKSAFSIWIERGYAYSSAKRAYYLLCEYFRYLTQQEYLTNNPMIAVPLMRKANYDAAQNKYDLSENESVVIFTPDEIERFKAEAFRRDENGDRIHKQAAAYILMLNTGLRTGEVLGIINSDIDFENRVVFIQRGVKEIIKRNGTESEHKRELRIGNPKTASSKRAVPLNLTAVRMIRELQAEAYFGANRPLIPDEKGQFTTPMVFRRRYYKILEKAGIEIKGLHCLRHTFATNLVNGVKQPDGTIKALSPRQVADILGHRTSQITELYYVKKDTSRLNGVVDGFEF